MNVPVFKPSGRLTYYRKLRNPATGTWRNANTHCKDKAAAETEARRLQVEEEHQALGLTDGPGCANRMLFLDAPDRYSRHLAKNKCAEDHRRQVERSVLRFALFCAGVPVPGKRLRGENLPRARRAVAHLRLAALTCGRLNEFTDSLPPDRSARTVNGLRDAVVCLFNYLVKHDAEAALPYNPLLKSRRRKAEPKRLRRALDGCELQRLVSSTPDRQRALFYLSAFYTGLRQKELRALRVKHVQLDAEPPHVHLPGGHTKNRRDAQLPLPRHLAEALRDWARGRRPEIRSSSCPSTASYSGSTWTTWAGQASRTRTTWGVTATFTPCGSRWGPRCGGRGWTSESARRSCATRTCS